VIVAWSLPTEAVACDRRPASRGRVGVGRGHVGASLVGTQDGEVAGATVAAAQRGDADAFVAIMRHHDRRLRLIAWRLVGDRSLMDDALQEVAIKAARALPGLRNDSALAAWLQRTTYRTCLDLLRREGRLEVRAPEDMPVSESVAADPADIVADRDAVARLLAALPADQRAAVVLVDQEGLDYRSTAKLLGVPTGTIASRLANARATLRRALTSPDEREGRS
jgi:RNA polymerase sigma-70 factor (ECF subfamily)